MLKTTEHHKRGFGPSAAVPVAGGCFRWIKKTGDARLYDSKIKRDGGKKAKGVIALMRSSQGVFPRARGAVFDSTKLFDTSRLQLAEASAESRGRSIKEKVDHVSPP